MTATHVRLARTARGMAKSKSAQAGSGRKTSDLQRLRVDQLLLDELNPRLPHFDTTPSQDDLLGLIVKKYGVTELMESFAISGYFDEEPLVAIRAPGLSGKYIVVEGNRRLAALRLLLDPARASAFRLHVPTLTETGRRKLRRIPVRIHRTRTELLPYLGYRHITGVLPWDSYSKARYVAQLVSAGEKLPDIQRRIGDRHETASRLYRAYLSWQQAEAKGYISESADTLDFSYLFTGLTFKPILDFLGLTSRGVPKRVAKTHLANLQELTKYLYGSSDRKQKAAIQESRQIKYLAQALASPNGRAKLKAGSTVEEAIEAIPAQEARLARLLNRAVEALSQSVLLAPRLRKNPTLKELAESCWTLAKDLRKAFRID